MSNFKTEHQKPNEEDKSQILKRALRELGYAFYATIITLSFGALVYFNLPRIQAIFQSGKTSQKILDRSRAYSYRGNGILIHLSSNSPSPSKNEMARLDMDQNILKRRFERGDFTIASISGLKSTKEYKAISKRYNEYKYQVYPDKIKPNAIVLEITTKSNSPPALIDLQNYIKYIEKNWIL